MHNVMLVDDDVPVLDFLKHTIPWDRLGLRLQGAYENGLKALEAAQKEDSAPDILVTDIGMPQMDGLQLIERLKAMNPALAVIILSCHDEFKFAQQAIKLGVDDYVLKETVQPDTIGTMLESVVGRIAERKRAELSVASRLQAEPDNRLNAAKERFIRSALYHPIFDPDAWGREAEQFGVRFGGTPVVPVLAAIDRYSEAKARFVSEDNFAFAVENVMDELLAQRGGAASFRVTNREIILLFGPSPAGEKPAPAADLALRRIREALHTYLKLSVSFVIGESCAEPRLLREAIVKLVNGRGQRFYMPEGSIAAYADVAFCAEDLFDSYTHALEEFRQIVLEQQAERIDEVVAAWTGRIRAGRYPPETVKEWFLKLLLDLHLKFKTMEHVPSAYSRESLHQTFLEADRLDRLADIAAGFMRDAVRRMESIYGQPQRTEIAEAIRYVTLNLHRKITLEEVAGHLHLNPSYFSRLFKKETGETFVDFVIRSKMERAKELLDQSKQSVHEIADRLGYDNKSYFVKLFKAYSGLTPGEYAGRRSNAKKSL